uniref:N-acetyltransferase domain-containing protein n=1 Tax=Leptobrachium leishanense TaxID=445787 RepID=A0A8C5LN30_9ANUR
MLRKWIPTYHRGFSMANVSIRRYKSSDYDMVRLLFAEGVKSHIPYIYTYLAKLPQVHFVLLTTFLIVFSISRSYLLSLMSVALVLVCSLFLLYTLMGHSVRKCHNGDLFDIEKSYMTDDKSCFWVAETNGRVVGIVGVQPVKDSEGVILLRRLSVAKNQRGRGIARSLCQTVIDFARQYGVKHINLDTGAFQRPAHRLYENIGFEKTRVKYIQTLPARFANISVLYYTYNVK